MTADELIQLLQLKPHPEGGHFRETFRDHAGHDGRSRATAIYFLLKQGESSAWHRIDAAEVWHFYTGAPLLLRIASQAGHVEMHWLGADLAAGERPQAVVPPGAWQSAETLGDWTLVGCTVAPGFLFEHFQMPPAGWKPGQEIP